MTLLDERLSSLIDNRKAKGRFRQLREYDTSSASGLIDFSSNDYLSLTSTLSLRAAYLARLAAAPAILGSTGSRLLSGCTPAHSSLESRLAKHFESPSALVFNSGWDANVSFFATVPQQSDWVLYDELVHASVHSGLRASRVPPERRIPFAHNDPLALARALAAIPSPTSISSSSTLAHAQAATSASAPTGTVFLALESLYSMDGDFAPLPALLDVLDAYVPRSAQCVVVDEAHSTGVYGSQGRGVVHALGEVASEAFGRKDGALLPPPGEGKGRVDVRLMTFGKAVGCSGAVLLCSETVRTFLINFARPLIFSTALPHSTLIALECAWDLLQSSEGQVKRDDLFNAATHLHDLLAPLLARTPRHILSLPPASPVPFPSSHSVHLAASPMSPIHGLLTSSPHALAAFLLERGFIVRPVVPPTVPPGGERVRICLRAGMPLTALEALVDALDVWVDRKLDEEGRAVVKARL